MRYSAHRMPALRSTCLKAALLALGTTCAAGAAATAEPAADLPRPLLEQPVDFVGEAATIQDVVLRLFEQLHVSAVLAQPPTPETPQAAADTTRPAGAAPASPVQTPPPRHFAFRQRPLREVLNEVTATFGYEWREAAGIYVFTSRAKEVRSSVERVVAEVAPRVSRPPKQALADVAASLANVDIGRNGIDLRQLAAPVQDVVRQAVAYGEWAVLQRQLRELDRELTVLAGLERMSPGRFLETGYVHADYDQATGAGSLRITFRLPAPSGLLGQFANVWSGPIIPVAPKDPAGLPIESQR